MGKTEETYAPALRNKEEAIMKTASYMKPALIGGVVTGVLSAAPLIGAGNCICCLYVWAGSILAAYFLFKDFPSSTLGDGALVGLFSGIMGAIIDTMVSLPIMLFFWKDQDIIGNLPPETLDALDQMPPIVMQMFETMSNPSPGSKLAVLGVGFVTNLFVFALIGTIGGMIGASMFRDKTPQPMTPPPPLPPSPPPQ
jgi:hypothetical protein